MHLLTNVIYLYVFSSLGAIVYIIKCDVKPLTISFKLYKHEQIEIMPNILLLYLMEPLILL